MSWEGEVIVKCSSMNTLGFIGLGRMGARIVERLLEKKINVVAYNRSPEPLAEVAKKGAIAANGIADLCSKISSPRIIWIMVSAGKPVDEVIDALVPSLAKGDILIDGGNSNYKDSVRRAQALKAKGIYCLDCGTSGGLEGARNGACLTIGGEKEAYERAKPLFEAIAAKDANLYVGSAGAGHFVKMVHNAIEYGMLEAYGEGFEMLKRSLDYKLKLAPIAKNWCKGSVVRSWLLDLCARALEKDEEMTQWSGEIGGGETGTWAVEYSKSVGAEIPVIDSALKVRNRKDDEGRYAGKIVGAIRREFGGHGMKRK
ncbi:MAG: decarboxylating 6-phosphogluconate dehydrogenase [Candidatus Burarchaeum sp.]|nr:decarboxylating 6-phosphogluconate dehydrogenase [Candidatus Burarchaeum sp.]MDO8339578.1 decarboxylating 6-phosphogluconate dehydrogenase [Candidatus Burarchaeum sp.]